ncbi:hypothetical protein [Xylocopilactobacillus apis]|uniref:DUF3188 domain-containing protein n=1 Tax=Xylocopilactobacillus apis TaxID=2932183 RepID=A0AAU9DAD1_9LACO|nr:hypothetical protein [Xylocopilactobacillus apis]BDR56610.1 hypothetical protein KIMC2_11720 [Xylocopilactobacillus apis]
MDSQLKKDLLAIAGGFFITMISPTFNSKSPIFYYTFMIAGIIIVVSGVISYLRDSKKNGKDQKK